MQLTRSFNFPGRRAQHLVQPSVAAHSQRERNQRANVNEDAALYQCGCGYVFKAPVTTSVGCPHCGSSQAW